MFGPRGIAVPLGPEGDIREVSQSVAIEPVSQMPRATSRGAGQALAETTTGVTGGTR